MYKGVGEWEGGIVSSSLAAINRAVTHSVALCWLKMACNLISMTKATLYFTKKAIFPLEIHVVIKTNAEREACCLLLGSLLLRLKHCNYTHKV